MGFFRNCNPWFYKTSYTSMAKPGHFFPMPVYLLELGIKRNVRRQWGHWVKTTKYVDANSDLDVNKGRTDTLFTPLSFFLW